MKREDIIERVLFLCASFSTIVIFLIVYYLMRNGINIISLEFIFGMTYNPGTMQFGIFPIIITNIATALYALIIATIIGLPTAIFLSEYSPFWLRNIMKPLIEVIVGIPSVVIGFWGLIVLVPIIRNLFPSTQGQSMLTGAIVLAFMTLPTLISLAEDSLRAVPNAYREASLALGATKWQTITRVIFPSASSGVRASMVLAMGRAVGETMAALLVIGNPYIPWITLNPLSIVRTLPTTIALEFSYVEFYSTHYYSLFGMGVVLFITVLIMNLVATYITGRGEK
jgi:phosphate ABC transporter permease protein PstC